MISIFAVYSPDEQLWYLERRVPGNWAVSQTFGTEASAWHALRRRHIIWELL